MNPTFHYIIIAVWTIMVFVFVQKKEEQHDKIDENAERQSGSCKRTRELLSQMSVNYTAELAEHKRDIKRYERLLAEKDEEILRLTKSLEWWESVAKKVKLGGCKR